MLSPPPPPGHHLHHCVGCLRGPLLATVCAQIAVWANPTHESTHAHTGMYVIKCGLSHSSSFQDRHLSLFLPYHLVRTWVYFKTQRLFFSETAGLPEGRRGGRGQTGGSKYLHYHALHFTVLECCWSRLGGAEGPINLRLRCEWGTTEVDRVLIHRPSPEMWSALN